MSEADGIDDFLDNSMRQSLLIASGIAETLARRWQEAQRQQEHQDTQAAHETQARLAAERSAAHAALAAVHKDQWWETAQPADIAAAHAVAEGWKDRDPTALEASEKIRHEVLTRYGIFNRFEGIGREIENRVTGNDSNRLKDQELKAETASAAGYGSAGHQEAFAESLGNSGANETQIRGRLAAARSEGTHPRAAVTMKGAARATKTRTAAALDTERAKSGPPDDSLQ